MRHSFFNPSINGLLNRFFLDTPLCSFPGRLLDFLYGFLPAAVFLSHYQIPSMERVRLSVWHCTPAILAGYWCRHACYRSFPGGYARTFKSSGSYGERSIHTVEVQGSDETHRVAWVHPRAPGSPEKATALRRRNQSCASPSRHHAGVAHMRRVIALAQESTQPGLAEAPDLNSVYIQLRIANGRRNHRRSCPEDQSQTSGVVQLLWAL
jgi:hypothetical protein